MNFSVYSADRATHLRIVVTALVASIVIVGFAMSLRLSSNEATQVVGAGRPYKIELPNREAVMVSTARFGARRI